jgi:hypothetical protein
MSKYLSFSFYANFHSVLQDVSLPDSRASIASFDSAIFPLQPS